MLSTEGAEQSIQSSSGSQKCVSVYVLTSNPKGNRLASSAYTQFTSQAKICLRLFSYIFVCVCMCKRNTDHRLPLLTIRTLSVLNSMQPKQQCVPNNKRKGDRTFKVCALVVPFFSRRHVGSRVISHMVFLACVIG